MHGFLKVLLWFVAALFTVNSVALWQLPDGRMHVWFFDVGQGDSAFMRMPEGQTVLIDGGPSDSVLERLGSVMPYFDRDLDLVILTHPHADHLDGLVEVLKRYEVGMVLFGGVDYDSSVYDEFLSELLDGGRFGGRFVAASQDTDFVIGPVLLDVLYPFEQIYGESFSNLNNSSVVFELGYGDLKILFTGDAEAGVEEELVTHGSLEDVDILKVGHHGSDTSSGNEFLGVVEPELAIISVGSGNQFGHPKDEVLERLEKAGVEVRRTDVEGTVELVF